MPMCRALSSSENTIAARQRSAFVTGGSVAYSARSSRQSRSSRSSAPLNVHLSAQPVPFDGDLISRTLRTHGSVPQRTPSPVVLTDLSASHLEAER
jgi:hypothetical protein